MRDKRAAFCLFYPEPMEQVDMSNLTTSGVMRVQLFLGVALNRPEQLRWLASVGRRVILRLDEPSRYRDYEVAASYYSEAGRAAIVDGIGQIKQIVPVEAVIAGNEPEIEYDLRRSSDPGANWGDKPEPLFPKGRVWEHQYAVGEMRKALAPLGVKVVAPGWSHKRKTPRDAPEPGRATWGRVCTEVYNQGPAGLHAYAINYSGPAGPEDENRLLWHVGHELERIQGEAWINEIDVATQHMGPVERMWCVTQMYDLVAAYDESDAIKSFCFFASNGRSGEPWSHMIIRDPEAYRVLAGWLGQ